MKELIFKASDGYEISYAYFKNENPKAIILIMHGMEEHKQRYTAFATYLCENGYSVLVSDMRGHGKNAPKLGFFHPKDGASRLVKDYYELTEMVKKENPNVPLYLFAHSMGTITARVLIQKHSKEYTKVVLCGYPNYNPAAPIGALLTKIIGKFKGKDGHSKFVSSLCFSGFTNAVKDRRTEFDWLSYDEGNVNNYIEDGLCGNDFTIRGFHDLFVQMQRMHKLKGYQNTHYKLPIFMISGEDDPCTGGKKGRKSSIERLKKAGFTHIKDKTYPNMRHEILNEKGKKEVYQDVLNFYNE